jgi:hypothetical protein
MLGIGIKKITIVICSPMMNGVNSVTLKMGICF